MRDLLIGLMLLFPVTATASEFKRPNGIWYTLTDPPARYASGPTGKVDLTEMSAKRLEAYCTEGTGKFEDLSCASLISGPLGSVCFIAIRNDLSQEAHEMILNHEYGHCRGWSGDHPE